MNYTDAHDNLRTYLQTELVRRCQQNPRYSLRSFARTLKIHPGSLSQILSGRRKLSSKLAISIGLRAGLSPEQLSELLRPQFLNEQSKAVHELRFSGEEFSVIADWYYHGIFNLLNVEQFQSNPRWIAKALGISANEVNLAIARLKKLDIISEDPKTKTLTPKVERIQTAHNTHSHTAFRRLQSQLLDLAKDSLEKYDLDVRDSSSIIIAMDSATIEEAQEKIAKFRNEMSQLFKKRKKKNSVYALEISLFPLFLEERKK